MFNPFEICVVDKTTGRMYRKDDIDYLSNYSNTIVLLELKERVNGDKFKLGDVYFDEKQKDYYIFTIIKNKNELDSKAIGGYGFFVFNEKINLPSECKLYHGVNFIKDKELDFLCNIFKDKKYALSIIKYHYMYEYHNYLSSLNDVEFYFQLDKGKVIHNTLIEADAGSGIFTKKNMQHDFNFNIVYRQRILIQSIHHRTVIENGGLIHMRDSVKKSLSNRDFLRNEILFNSTIDADVIPEKVLGNLVSFFDKFFIFLDDGSVKITSLNKKLNHDDIDYTLYLKVTGKDFCLIEDDTVVKKSILEFL